MEDVGTSEEEDTDNQDSNIPMDHGQARIQREGQGARAPLSDHTTIIKFSDPMLKYFLHSFAID